MVRNWTSKHSGLTFSQSDTKPVSRCDIGQDIPVLELGTCDGSGSALGWQSNGYDAFRSLWPLRLVCVFLFDLFWSPLDSIALEQLSILQPALVHCLVQMLV